MGKASAGVLLLALLLGAEVMDRVGDADSTIVVVVVVVALSLLLVTINSLGTVVRFQQ